MALKRYEHVVEAQSNYVRSMPLFVPCWRHEKGMGRLTFMEKEQKGSTMSCEVTIIVRKVAEVSWKYNSSRKIG